MNDRTPSLPLEFDAARHRRVAARARNQELRRLLSLARVALGLGEGPATRRRAAGHCKAC